MSKIDDLAAWLSGDRLETKNYPSTTTINGTAVSDSKDGFVDVIIGDDTLTYNDSGISVAVATTVQIKKDDTVIILLTGDTLTKEARIIGVVGRGDETAEEVKTAQDTATTAQDTAEAAFLLETGDATRVGGCTTGSFVHYYKNIHSVEVEFYVAPTTTVSPYGQAKNLLRGLPATINDDVGFIASLDGSAATALAHIDTRGYFWLEAREESIPANTHVLGHFTYMTPNE